MGGLFYLAAGEGFEPSAPSALRDAIKIFVRLRIPPYITKSKTAHPLGGLFYLAAGEGFEPSQTESESGVLPLHKPAKRKSYYTRI